MWEQQRIPFLSINEICYLVLGRGGAVGAGRELPAHPRVPALTVPNRSCRSCHGRNAKRRKAHALPRGLRAPATPAPPFFGSPKKGGKESSPLATTQGFCLRRATPTLPLSPHTGVAGVARTGPRPKALQPAGSRQGQKTPHRPPHRKRITTRTGSA